MEKPIISNNFISEVKRIITNAQNNVVRTIDTERVIMYWNIGKQIVEEEQNGKDRADYGSFIIKKLSEELLSTFGSGFSQRQLETCRQFYFAFPIPHTLRAELNWSQYKLLIRIKDIDKQTYYIEESCKNNWSARQKRIHLNDDDFFVDLVFYNRLLRCFVVIEIKTHKITHQDIGQLQMYVNYYDRKEKQKDENKTIGILLCADKNDAVVEMVLPKNNNTILTSKYQLYLPTKEQILNQVNMIEYQTENKNNG